VHAKPLGMPKKQRHGQRLKQQIYQEKKSTVNPPVEDKNSVASLATDGAGQFDEQKGKVVGLVNLGGTCFFNAAVQVNHLHMCDARQIA